MADHTLGVSIDWCDGHTIFLTVHQWNDLYYTVSTLEVSSTLAYCMLHCSYDSTMVNGERVHHCVVPTRLYIGIVFECSFNHHKEVHIGPAILNLMATGMFSGSQCNTELENGAAWYMCTLQ